MTKKLLSDRRISKFNRIESFGTGLMADLHKNPVLTRRDKDVLLSVYYHRCLTTEQIAEMHFRLDAGGKVNNQASVIARRRLRKLYDLRLVDRFFIDMGENNGSSQAHVMLDELGAKVVAGLLNIPYNQLSWRYEMNDARLPYLGHMVSVNDFYVELLKVGRKRGGMPEAFRTENHIRHEFMHWGEKKIFNPDAYGQYFEGDEGFHFFLEWDNDTMTAGTFQKKHQKYSAFYDSGEYRKGYENFPVVLTVTPTVHRADVLRKVVKSADATDMIWLFTSEDRIRDNVLGNIWVNTKGEAASLMD